MGQSSSQTISEPLNNNFKEQRRQDYDFITPQRVATDSTGGSLMSGPSGESGTRPHAIAENRTSSGSVPSIPQAESDPIGEARDTRTPSSDESSNARSLSNSPNNRAYRYWQYLSNSSSASSSMDSSSPKRERNDIFRSTNKNEFVGIPTIEKKYHFDESNDSIDFLSNKKNLPHNHHDHHNRPKMSSIMEERSRHRRSERQKERRRMRPREVAVSSPIPEESSSRSENDTVIAQPDPRCNCNLIDNFLLGFCRQDT